MPVIKSAIKKDRKDKKREKNNIKYIKNYEKIFDLIKKKIKLGNKNIVDLIKKYYSAVDKASKVKVIHKNKASRLKSKIRKFFNT